ncbi:MAG: hypothetical protein M0Q91_08830 [Methanoregula sp.]|nr:hypothetical protein [Methanoregula sp.]
MRAAVEAVAVLRQLHACAIEVRQDRVGNEKQYERYAEYGTPEMRNARYLCSRDWTAPVVPAMSGPPRKARAAKG